jgi:hypothetical protein
MMTAPVADHVIGPGAASATPSVKGRYARFQTRTWRSSRQVWPGGVSIASLLLLIGAAAAGSAALSRPFGDDGRMLILALVAVKRSSAASKNADQQACIVR